MSELQDVCAALEAIDGDILQMARELHAKAWAYGRASQRAAAAARVTRAEDVAALARTAAALDVAARHCAQAAATLTGASREGQAYVRRTAGAVSVADYPPAAAADSSGGDGAWLADVGLIEVDVADATSATTPCWAHSGVAGLPELTTVGPYKRGTSSFAPVWRMACRVQISKLATLRAGRAISGAPHRSTTCSLARHRILLTRRPVGGLDVTNGRHRRDRTGTWHPHLACASEPVIPDPSFTGFHLPSS
jgi:hypothetical protein